MASLDEFLWGLFAFLGPLGQLVALFLIFVLDALLFPALPELWFVLTYSFPPVGWDLTAWSACLLAMAIAGEAVGNTGLYLIVKRLLVQRKRMPRWLERGMRKWTGFLLVHDERVILLNRVAPVLPMVGAFIATLGWDYRKSLAYILLGAAAKYAVLLVLVGFVGVVYDPGVARWIAVGLVLVIVAISAGVSVVLRRRSPVPSEPR